ncbi:MAG: SH3 domain-containing protein [Candidatus Hermodarchaeota archaeon]
MERKAKVIKSHHSDVSIPFKAEKGEIVSCKEKLTQWEGWFYCKKKAGIEGWVPKAFLTPIKNSSEQYKFIRDYNAYEITATEGEVVKIKEIESGWAWIENINGEFGWIPLENLDL